MMAVPYIGPLERKPMTTGLTIEIHGSPSPIARRININLQCGPSVNPRDDVAFNLSIDFDNRCLIMNSILGNQWGPQECDSRLFPFQRNIPFSMDITCESSGFKILVNGSNCFKFEHRIDPSRITHLAIDGDIVLHKIVYSGGMAGSTGGLIGFNVPPSIPVPTSYPASVPPPYQSVPVGGACPYPPAPTPYSQPLQPTPYPAQVYPATPHYQQQPGIPSHQPNLYPAQQPNTYPQQHGLYPQQPHTTGPHSPSTQPKQGMFDKIGGLAGGVVAGTAGLAGLKHMKKQAKISKKAQKKALKYGIPIAGVGLGAYALKKSHGFGMFKGSSSSSSSSSDSD